MGVAESVRTRKWRLFRLVSFYYYLLFIYLFFTFHSIKLIFLFDFFRCCFYIFWTFNTRLRNCQVPGGLFLFPLLSQRLLERWPSLSSFSFSWNLIAECVATIRTAVITNQPPQMELPESVTSTLIRWRGRKSSW